MMRTGEMRHRVRIERQSSTRNEVGEPVNSWVIHAERRASMRRDPGHEQFSSQRREGIVPTEFRLRYLPGVLPRMRLTLVSETPNRLYNVTSAIDVDGRRETLLITAEEHVEASV